MRKREATKKNVKPDSVELLLRLPASRSINCAAEKETFSAEDDLSDARQTCLADKRDIPGTPKGHANAAPEQQLIKATAKRREHKVTSHKRLTTPTQRMRIRMQMAKTFFLGWLTQGCLAGERKQQQCWQKGQVAARGEGRQRRPGFVRGHQPDEKG